MSPIGCACGKNRLQRSGKSAKVQYEFKATPESEPVTYLTLLEARRAVRTNGGGAIRSVPVGA